MKMPCCKDNKSNKAVVFNVNGFRDNDFAGATRFKYLSTMLAFYVILRKLRPGIDTAQKFLNQGDIASRSALV